MSGSIDRRILSILCLTAVVILAGCSLVAGADEAASEEAHQYHLQQDQTYPKIFHTVMNQLDNESAEKFEALLTDESGELTTEGEQLLDLLETADELGSDKRDATAELAIEKQTIRDDFLVSFDHILDNATADETVANLTAELAQGGYDNTSIRYLERVIEIQEYQDNEYEVWAQADQLGLLDEAAENGTVTEEQLWQLENNASNRLLNGMEVEFGTDPELADTSGDGYEDHNLWGPLQDLGLDVNPDAVNLFVEVDTASGVDSPTTEQQEMIQETFREEPPDDIGPVSVKFLICETDLEGVEEVEDMHEFTEDNRNVTGLGFHYLFVTDGLDDGQVQGASLTASDEASWMIVDGTLNESFDETYEAAVIAHELGHSFGIDDEDYEGVDSFEIPITEYNSVMNYNHQGEEITFSTGEPFDDYEHMANQTFGSEYQDRDELTAMWENGAVDEDALC